MPRLNETLEDEALDADRTRRVREKALSLGFQKVGFARADHADPKGRLQAWLERGHHGALDYMETTKREREDPRILMPGAESVVALAMSYYRPEVIPTAPLKVSRYAVGADYHGTLRRKIRKLRRFILSLDAKARIHPAVDTSPVLERAWAERAGIAWIGKSTMAIAQDLGTYTFLAALITTMRFVYGKPHENRCGTCTACLDACPTNAFAGPYDLDARRCITYWNVEERGQFTENTPDLSGWVAGCDVCQEVCPWNKYATPTDEPRFQPREVLLRAEPQTFTDPERAADLVEILRGTALQRTGEEAIRRNALRILEPHSHPTFGVHR